MGAGLGGAALGGDEPVWAQVAAGNARSRRAFQASGCRPVASEALFIALLNPGPARARDRAAPAPDPRRGACQRKTPVCPSE